MMKTYKTNVTILQVFPCVRRNNQAVNVFILNYRRERVEKVVTW